MKITAIIPTYNRANLLPLAIESILNQSYRVDEIIVIDDGSSDNTQDILKRYEDVKVIKTENLGVSHARNIGIKNAKNNWIALLDSDDIWEKGKIEKQINFHKKNPDILFSHTNEIWIRDTKKIKYPKSLKKPQGECFLQNISTCKIAASSILVYKNVFEDIGYFDESMRVCEDYDMWLKITYRYKIGLIEEELITKFAGHSQLSSTIFAIDKYHIHSLINFLDTKFRNEITKEIQRKCNILTKGAIKHNNQDILEIVRNIQTLLSNDIKAI